MRTTESSSSASCRAGVSVFSVAHERVSRPRPRTRLSHYIKTPTNTAMGWLLCHRVILGSVARPVGPGKDTHGTRGPVRGKAVGGPTTSHDTRRTTRHTSSKRASQPGADRHLKTNMVAEQRDDLAASRTLSDYNFQNEIEHTSPTQSKWRFPESSRRPTQSYQRRGTYHPEEDQPGDRAHQDSGENQYSDKIVDLSVAVQRQFPQMQTLRRKSQRGSARHCFPIREELERETRQVSCGLDLRYSKRAW